MLFFDRAMYVYASVASEDAEVDFVQACHGKRATRSPPHALPGAPPCRLGLTSQGRADPLPHRPHHHHRPTKDAPLLRPEAKSQRHGCLLRRADPHLHAMDLDRLRH